MPRIVECVPNCSEGRNQEVIDAIASSISNTPGCSLLHVLPGISTNRTVFTFVGSPETVIEGAMNVARTCYKLIDMRHHSGNHPRMGAMDVCPFIPVQDVTEEECVELANKMGEKLSKELGVPVFLYGAASTIAYRKSLPQVRAGEYEALPEKLKDPLLQPNYGPSEFVPQWGATACGVRKFLTCAYNVNLLGTKEQAHRIALNIREIGRGENEPGKLKCVRALGWYLEEENMAQVSINITDMGVTGIHDVYDEVVKEAKELNVSVVGSQIVGLFPLKALLASAEYYIKKENLFILEEDQKLRLAINRLGLDSFGPFNPKERLIEYMCAADKDGPLASMDVKDFIMTVGSRTSTPGGGSVAALCASLGAALGSMVGFLTYGNRKFCHLDSEMRKLIPPLYKGMKDLVPFIDADAAAFSEFTLATKLPKKTEQEEKEREEAMKKGLLTAVQVPMCVAKIANDMWPVMKELAHKGNIDCKSDLQTGAHVLETGVWGAYYNVQTNLSKIKDTEFVAKMSSDIDSALATAQNEKAEVLKILSERKN